MYLGTRIKFNATFLPKYKGDKVEPFLNYTSTRKVVEISKSDVISKSKEETLKNIVSHLNELNKEVKKETYGDIILISSNANGNNLLIDVNDSYLVSVIYYTKKGTKQNKSKVKKAIEE